MEHRLTYSIVLPVYNEQETLEELSRRLGAALEQLDGEAEVIFVDDGSTDMTYAILVELARRDPRFKAVVLSRNFGHQIAITAGVEIASGDAVIIMDADLQHPPELLPELARHWRNGFDIVYAVMEGRPEPRFKRTTARVFYRVLRALTKTEMPAAAGDFRLVDRRAADAFLTMRERSRYVRGMFAWLGYRQIGVPYTAEPRFAGRSKYTLRKMLRLGTDAILSFSDAPLRLVLNVGFVVSVCSVLFGVASLASKLAGAYVVPGWLTIVLVMSLLGGIQLVVIGVVGEYVGRIYEEVKQRPLYLVRELHGLERAESRPRVPDVIGE